MKGEEEEEFVGPSEEEEEEEEDMAGRWRGTERGGEVGAWSLFLWWFEGRGEKEAEAIKCAGT